MDRHVWEIGKSKVIVSGGRVVSVVSEPLTKFCPINYSAWGTEKQTKETVKKSIEFRIGAFGLCTPERILETDISAVGFGASESLMTALKQKIIDVTVTVCDGAGTVITEKPTLVEGIGVFMSALIETTPIPEVISELEKKGATILNPHTAEINQVAGVKKSFKMGYRKVGVTMMGPDAQAIPKIRLLEEENKATVLVIVVHTTGIGQELAPFIEKADIVYGCASKVVRETIGPKALSTFGKNIPAYALTKLGEEVLRVQEKAISKNNRILKIALRRPPFPLS
ncbi:MAG: hypothetical protein AOA66_1747 [Candidatus Bathyarchaeota archaeon BA2]|nr:MAG: hypothetical protein AOA66_1747 [Candidatus Bathyarchaeota archaeon BA2]